MSLPGTYSSAITGDTELSRLLLEFGKQSDDDGEASGSEETVVDVAAPAKLELDDFTPMLRQKASVALMRRAEPVPVAVQKRETLRALKQSTRPKERREQGSVKFGVYKNFIKANSYMGVSFYMITIVLQQTLQISTNVWLKNWSQHNAETGDNGNLAYYLGIYAALGLGASFVFLANGLLLYSLCVIRSAKVMHDSMFRAVMRSPMQFFGQLPGLLNSDHPLTLRFIVETTPLGTVRPGDLL